MITFCDGEELPVLEALNSKDCTFGEMKDSIKKVITYIGGLNGVMCILYTSLILSSYAFVSKLIIPDDIAMPITGFRMALFVRSVGIIVVGAILVCPLILRKVKTLSMNQDEKTYDKKWFLYLFVIIFFGNVSPLFSVLSRWLFTRYHYPVPTSNF